MKSLILILVMLVSPLNKAFSSEIESYYVCGNDTLFKKQKINTFSLILEGGQSNIFNSMSKSYEDGYVRIYDPKGISGFQSQRIYNLYATNFEGNLSYSFGISLNHKLISLSKGIFKRNYKNFIELKYEITYNNLMLNVLKKMQDFMFPIEALLISNQPKYESDYDFFKVKSLNLEIIRFSPSLRINKNLTRNTNLLFSFGSDLMISSLPDVYFNDFQQFVEYSQNDYDITKLSYFLGGQGFLGISYKKISIGLKYQTSIIPIFKIKSRHTIMYYNDGAGIIKPFPFSSMKNTALQRLESLNLSTAFTF